MIDAVFQGQLAKSPCLGYITCDGVLLEKTAQTLFQLIHHSDRGSQYASHTYQELLKQHSMACTMNRKENYWNNSPTESFFSSLKRE